MRIPKFRLFLKIPMGYASVNFSGWFRLKGKLCKMLAVILSTKCVVFKLRSGREAAGLQPLPCMRLYYHRFRTETNDIQIGQLQRTGRMYLYLCKRKPA